VIESLSAPRRLGAPCAVRPAALVDDACSLTTVAKRGVGRVGRLGRIVAGVSPEGEHDPDGDGAD
jgi:hypothetical protein